MNEPTIELRLPPAFIIDHIDRDLLRSDAVVKETRTYVVVALTDDELAELLSDARHYADPVNGYSSDPLFRGLARSAAATVRAIDRLREGQQ
jgi:hypothetical protein